MKVDGQCHCGEIAFEAEIDPKTVSICHCADCQTLTGTAFRISVPVPAAQFHLRRGTPKSYVKQTAESGNPRRQAFCGTCGTPIYASAADDNPPSYMLRVGAITQRAELTPHRQIWRRSALDWVDGMADLPANEKQ
jgi:hypothetical protein